MSERISKPRGREPLKITRGQAIAAVAGGVLASAVVGGVVGSKLTDQSGTVRHLQHESQAKTESLAAAQAASFTAALYDPQQYPKGVPMPVLNGETVLS